METKREKEFVLLSSLVLCLLSSIFLMPFIPFASATTYIVNSTNYSLSDCLFLINNTANTCEINEANYNATINTTTKYVMNGTANTGVITLNASNITLDCNGSELRGNDISNTYGIYANKFNYSTIKNCEVSDYLYDIAVQASSFGDLINNTVNSSTIGIVYISSSFNNLVNNTVNSSGYGIYLSASSDYNNLTNNIIDSSTQEGIILISSSYNNLTQNNMSNNSYGFSVTGSSDSHFNQTADTTNTVNNKPIYYLVNVKNQVYDGAINAGYFACVFCDNITVKNLNLTKNGQGLLLYKSPDSEISNINASNNRYGIYLDSSNNSNVFNNTVNSNRQHGICLNSSSSSNVSGNTVNSNSRSGIYLDSSNNSNVFNNTANSNTVEGIFLDSSSNSNISRNTANSNSRHGIFLDSSSNSTVSRSTANLNGEYGIYLSSSPNSNISKSTANDNIEYGIYLGLSNNSGVFDSTANNNPESGIYLDSSSIIDISGNTANNNTEYGIHLPSSSIKCSLVNNTVSLNRIRGIWILSVSNNITNNTVSHNQFGIRINSAGNNITQNIIEKNLYGLSLAASGNTIKNNTILNNDHDFVHESNNLLSNQFLNNLDSTMLNSSLSYPSIAINANVSFNISMFHLNGSACLDCTYNISTRPSETVEHNKSGNVIKGNFTVTRLGTYSLIVNVTDADNNFAERKYVFLVNATGSNAINYYFRTTLGMHGQPKWSDAKSLLFTKPTIEESWTCNQWIQASPDELPDHPAVIIQDTNISVWYKASKIAQLGIQRYATYDKVEDYNKSVPVSSEYVYSSKNFNPNWTTDYSWSWYWFSVKLQGLVSTSPFWKSNATEQSTVNITYNYTTTPEITNITNSDIDLLAATSPSNSTNNATIILDGTGTTNITVQMPNTAVDYVAKMNDVDCVDANCNFTQSNGRLNFVLTLASENTIEIDFNDTTAPSISLNPSTNQAMSLGGTLSITCSASDNVALSSTPLKIDGETVCSSPCTYTYTAITTGSRTVECSATDTSGNSKSKSITLTIETVSREEAPSGIGGASSSTIITQASAEEPITISIDQDAIPFTYLELDVIKQLNNVKITVNSLLEKPIEISDVEGAIYNYLTVDRMNIGDADVEKVIIEFRVLKSWMEENSLDEKSVVLNRYVEEWVELPTWMIEQSEVTGHTVYSDDYFYYKAESPGLDGYFAISAKGIKVEEEIPFVEKEVLPELSKITAKSLAIIFISILVAAGLVYYFVFRKKH